MADEPREQVPPGWDYNPSAWGQRVPIVAMAILGFAAATYLALWQYGVIARAWDPFFSGGEDARNGTEAILSSHLSWPFENLFGLNLPIRVSDAALGAFGYVLDAITGIIGGRTRWRRMPWMVLVFALFVGPLGAISIALVVAQPVVEGYWCTLCLVTAGISVVMIGPAMDEALASLQYLKRVHAEGSRSVWRVFWGLGDRERVIPAEQSPEPHPRRKRYLGNTNIPLQQMGVWAQGLATAVGVWIIAAPGVLGYGGDPGSGAYNDWIVGPVAGAIACIAMWEATRALRWWYLPLGIWMIIAAAVLDYPAAGRVSAAGAGAALVGLAFIRGSMHHRFAGGWKVLLASDPYRVRPDAGQPPRVPPES